MKLNSEGAELYQQLKEMKNKLSKSGGCSEFVTEIELFLSRVDSLCLT